MSLSKLNRRSSVILMRAVSVLRLLQKPDCLEKSSYYWREKCLTYCAYGTQWLSTKLVTLKWDDSYVKHIQCPSSSESRLRTLGTLLAAEWPWRISRSPRTSSLFTWVNLLVFGVVWNGDTSSCEEHLGFLQWQIHSAPSPDFATSSNFTPSLWQKLQVTRPTSCLLSSSLATML